MKKGQRLDEIRELDLVDEINAKENLLLQSADLEIQRQKTFLESDIRRTDKHLIKSEIWLVPIERKLLKSQFRCQQMFQLNTQLN